MTFGSTAAAEAVEVGGRGVEAVELVVAVELADAGSPSSEGTGEGGREVCISTSSFSMHWSTRERSTRVSRSSAVITWSKEPELLV